jgi:hypothetical protein
MPENRGQWVIVFLLLLAVIVTWGLVAFGIVTAF